MEDKYQENFIFKGMIKLPFIHAESSAEKDILSFMPGELRMTGGME